MTVITAIFAVAILAVFIIAIPILGAGLGRKGTTKVHGKGHTLDKAFVKSKWLEIEASFAVAGASHMKSAVMEADKLVDYVLKAKGISGQTMGERLKGAKKYFPHYADYDNLWFAHKVRNNIAHEAGHDLSSAEARRALEYYKKTLKILGAI